MRGFVETLKTLAVLLVLWGAVLAGASFVVPWSWPTPPSGESGGSDAGVVAIADAASEDANASAPSEPVELDARDAVEALPDLAPLRARVCEAALPARWAVLDEADTQLVAVACAREIVLAGRTRGAFVRAGQVRWTTDEVVRDLRFIPVDATYALLISTSRALYFAPFRMDGSLSEPQVLAPLEHGAITIGLLDAEPGADFAVVHGGDDRPEVWVFRGGPTPSRIGTFAAPIAPVALAATDLDVDGHLDLLVVGSAQVMLAFGASSGAFRRARSIDLRASGALAVAEEGIWLERDDEVPCLLRPDPSMTQDAACGPQTQFPAGARALQASDTRRFAWVHPGLVEAGFAEARLTLRTSEFGVHAFHVRDGRVWLLASSPDALGGRHFELADVELGPASTLGTGTVEALERAPIVLDYSLPDANTP